MTPFLKLNAQVTVCASKKLNKQAHKGDKGVIVHELSSPAPYTEILTASTDFSRFFRSLWARKPEEEEHPRLGDSDVTLRSVAFVFLAEEKHC